MLCTVSAACTPTPGRLADAAALLRHALAGHDSVLEPGHRASLGAANNLGCMNYKQNGLAQAEELYARPLIINTISSFLLTKNNFMYLFFFIIRIK